MLKVDLHAQGAILSVKASPNSKQAGLTGFHEGALKVAITQPPEKGKANGAIVRALAAALGLRKGQIEAISGLTSREKRFLIRDLTPHEVEERICAIVCRT